MIPAQQGRVGRLESMPGYQIAANAQRWHLEPLWAGETAVIVAGGPSIRSMNLGLLRTAECRIIAVNDSYIILPWADCLYFCDTAWWTEHQERVRAEFRGEWIIKGGAGVAGVHNLAFTGQQGLDLEPWAIRHGSNSGYQAINVAVHFGVERIVLVGYDMRVAGDGRTHWHANRSNSNGYAQVLAQAMLPHFSTLVEPLRGIGIDVINATPDSALTHWRYEPLEEALWQR